MGLGPLFYILLGFRYRKFEAPVSQLLVRLLSAVVKKLSMLGTEKVGLGLGLLGFRV